MIGKGEIIGSLIVLVLLSAGTFLLLNSWAPLEKKNVLLNDSFSVAGNKYENRTVWVGSSGVYVASFTVSEGTIKFYPMISDEFSMWLEGQFEPNWEPNWVESEQTDYPVGISLAEEGDPFCFVFVFVNNDTIAKQVHLEVSRTWKETNYVALLGGTALILSGIIIGVILKYGHKTHSD